MELLALPLVTRNRLELTLELLLLLLLLLELRLLICEFELCESTPLGMRVCVLEDILLRLCMVEPVKPTCQLGRPAPAELLLAKLLLLLPAMLVMLVAWPCKELRLLLEEADDVVEEEEERNDLPLLPPLIVASLVAAL